MTRRILQAITKKPRIIFLAGPTGVGKSTLAIRLAKRIKGEIISCDSMQVYKGLDIVSSKPSRNMQGQVRHHLLDVVSPEEEFSAADYRRLAIKKIKEITLRNNTPLFVGGSGLYMNIVIDGIFKGVKKDEGLRKKLYALARHRGSVFLYNKLKLLDKKAASKIHPNDLRRVVRSLEVCKLSGKPISELWNKRNGLARHYDIKVFALNKERASLYSDINERVDKMFASGLVAEIKSLLDKKISLTCAQAIGINEIKGYLEGRYGLEDTKELLKKNTRRYAKRQLTWFRKDSRIRWIDVGNPRNNVREIIKLLMFA